MKRVLVLCMLGVIYKCVVGCRNRTICCELRFYVSHLPENLALSLVTPPDHFILDHLSRLQRQRPWPHRKRDFGSVFAYRGQAQLRRILPLRILVGNAKHFFRRLIRELNLCVRSKQDYADMEVPNQSSKTLFAGAQRLLRLLPKGYIRNRYNDVGNFSFRRKVWHGVHQGPQDLTRIRAAPSHHLISHRFFGRNRSGAWKPFQRDFRSVFSNGRHPEARTAPSVRFFFTHSKSLQSCSICKLYFRLVSKQDNADLQVMAEISQPFFAGPQRFFRLLVGGDIPNDGQGTDLSVQHHQLPGKLPDPCLAFLRQAYNLLIPPS